MTSEKTRCGVITVVLGAGLMLTGLVGCGSQSDPIDPPTTAGPSPAASTPAAPSPIESEVGSSPSATETGAPEEGTVDSEGPSASSDDESERPPVLDEKVTGRDLTMSDFFSAPDAWQDGRYDVAGERGLGGVSGPLSYCRTDQSEHETLELRLANRFKKISMKIGQSDESEQSDAVLNVRLLGNGKYIDSVKVPFNKIDEFTVAVSDVNALKLEIWIGGDKCDDGRAVGAVLSGLRLE